jgi:hypothetical protein
MTDREFVESVWDNVIGIYNYGGHTTYVSVARTGWVFMGGSEQEAWSAAAEFTRNRLEEIRQLDDEIGMIECRIAFSLGEVAHVLAGEQRNPESIAIGVKWGTRWSRILSRLEAIRADLTRGMKEKA